MVETTKTWETNETIISKLEKEFVQLTKISNLFAQKNKDNPTIQEEFAKYETSTIDSKDPTRKNPWWFSEYSKLQYTLNSFQEKLVGNKDILSTAPIKQNFLWQLLHLWSLNSWLAHNLSRLSYATSINTKITNLNITPEKQIDITNAFNKVCIDYKLDKLATIISLEEIMQTLNPETKKLTYDLSALPTFWSSTTNFFANKELTQTQEQTEKYEASTTKKAFKELWYTWSPTSTADFANFLTTRLPANINSSVISGYLPGIQKELYSSEKTIQYPALVLQSGLIRWINTLRTPEEGQSKPDPDKLTQAQYHLIHLSLILGDYTTSPALKQVRADTEQLIVVHHPDLYSVLWTWLLTPSNPDDGKMKAQHIMIARCALGVYTPKQKNILNPEGYQQQYNEQLLGTMTPPQAWPTEDWKAQLPFQSNWLIEMLRYKEKSDAWFGTTYTWLLDWAQKVGIDMTKFTEEIKQQIIAWQNITDETDIALISLFNPVTWGVFAIAKNQEKQNLTKQKELHERCTLYALDTLLHYFEMYTEHVIAADAELPKEYAKNHPKHTNRRTLDKEVISKDEAIYIQVMKEQQKELANEGNNVYRDIQLDANELMHAATKLGLSKPFMKKIATIKTIEQFKNAMQQAFAAFDQNPDGENSDIVDWIMLMQEIPGSTILHQPEQTNSNLDKLLANPENNAAVQRYSTFLTVSNKPDTTNLVATYAQMKSTLTGLFWGNNNFGAIASFCPLLASNMENALKNTAKSEADRLAYLQKHPVLWNLGSFGRWVWNGSWAMLGNILLTAHMIKNDLISFWNGARYYLHHQFMLQYLNSTSLITAKADWSLAYEAGNATGAVALSILISTATGGVWWTALSPFLREFLTGAIMKIPTYTKAMLAQAKAKGIQVNFGAAYRYMGVSMAMWWLSSQLNKSTLGGLNNGASMTNILVWFVALWKHEWRKIACKQTLMWLLRTSTLTEWSEEVTDSIFSAFTDFMFEKTSRDGVDYFAWLTLQDLFKTFLLGIVGMKTFKLGQITTVNIMNLPKHIDAIKDFLTTNGPKYKFMKIESVIDDLEAQETIETSIDYPLAFQNFLKKAVGDQRASIYRQEQQKTRKAAEKSLKRTPLTEDEKLAIWEAHLIWFGDADVDGYIIWSSENIRYTAQHIRAKARRLALCESIKPQERELLIKKGICGFFGNIMKWVFWDSPPKNMVFLPPSVLEALANGAQLDADHIAALQHEKYGDLWFYLAMKYFDSKPEIQNQIVAAYLTWDKKNVFAYITEQLSSNNTLSPIDWRKAAQVSRQWFEYFPNKVNELMQACRNDWRTPVVMLYAWILMMQTMMNQMQDGEQVCFLDPHKTTHYQWRIMSKKDGIITYTPINSRELPQDVPRKLRLLDDTINTGKSIDAMKQRFKSPFNVDIDGVIRLDKAKDASLVEVPETSPEEFQLWAEDIEIDKKPKERSHEDRKRIADNMALPENKRQEAIKKILTKQWIAPELHDTLISIFMDVHNTANQVDEDAPLLYENNWVKIYKRSREALQAKIKKWKDGYNQNKDKLKNLTEQQFSDLLKLMMREGLCGERRIDINLIISRLKNRKDYMPFIKENITYTQYFAEHTEILVQLFDEKLSIENIVDLMQTHDEITPQIEKNIQEYIKINKLENLLNNFSLHEKYALIYYVLTPNNSENPSLSWRGSKLNTVFGLQYYKKYFKETWSVNMQMYCRYRILQHALKKLPSFDNTVYRAEDAFYRPYMSPERAKQNLIQYFEELQTTLSSQKPFQIKRFFSTTKENVQEQMNDRSGSPYAIKFIIRSKNGKDISQINPGQSEVLFNFWSKFRITNMQVWMRPWWITSDLIDPSIPNILIQTQKYVDKEQTPWDIVLELTEEE